MLDYIVYVISQEWIQKNGVLSIVLKDNLHQPQVLTQYYDWKSEQETVVIKLWKYWLCFHYKPNYINKVELIWF